MKAKLLGFDAARGETWLTLSVPTDPSHKFTIGEECELQRSVEVCEWKEDEDGDVVTSCGNAWIFFSGPFSDLKMRFCSYCGRPLKEVKK